MNPTCCVHVAQRNITDSGSTTQHSYLSSCSPRSEGNCGIPAGGCLGGVAVLAAGRCAVLTDDIFPLEITYTEQNSGALFITVAGTS